MGMWKNFKMWWRGGEEYVPPEGTIRAREAMLKQIRAGGLKLRPLIKVRTPVQTIPYGQKRNEKQYEYVKNAWSNNGRGRGWRTAKGKRRRS